MSEQQQTLHSKDFQLKSTIQEEEEFDEDTIPTKKETKIKNLLEETNQSDVTQNFQSMINYKTELRNLRKLKNTDNSDYNRDSVIDEQGLAVQDSRSSPSRKKLSNVQETDDLIDLIKKDLNAHRYKAEQELAIQKDANKLSRINTLNVVDIKPDKDAARNMQLIN